MVALLPGATIAADDDSQALNLLVETMAATDDPGIRRSLLAGMLQGLEGRRNLSAPKGWSELSEQLAASDDARIREMSMQLSQLFGDQGAIRRAIKLVTDKSAGVNRRRTALMLLLSQRNQEAASLLESLLNEPELAVDAIRGYSIVENRSAPKILLERYSAMAPEQQRAVVETLSTRKPYAQALLAALQRDQIPRSDIPVHVARSLGDILGDDFFKVFGRVRPIGADREKLMARYKKMLTPKAIATADPSRGRVVFKKTCGSCHMLYGDGGKVGPDLTGSNRANLDYILLNSVDPSYDVPDAYKTVQIQTDDGRVINGVLAEEDDARVVLKTAEIPRVVVAKDDIADRKISPKSMMPDGQFDAMQKQEIIDLVRYLRTTEQVEMPK